MPTPPPLQLLQRRTVQVLVVAQLLGALGLAAGGTAGALLAEDLTGNAAVAGLPLLLRSPPDAGGRRAASTAPDQATSPNPP